MERRVGSCVLLTAICVLLYLQGRADRRMVKGDIVDEMVTIEAAWKSLEARTEPELEAKSEPEK